MARFGNSRRGFTMVEMLVVLAIIGILVAILVPTLGVAIRTVRQGAVRTEMKNMEAAIEQYKNKNGSYPIDFQTPGLIFPHVKSISRRAVGNEAVYLGWMTSDLPNPHYQQGVHPATYQTRNPSTMLQHEAIVFLLMELSENAEYPFGYRFDGTNWQLVDYTWDAGTGKFNLTGTKKKYFEFHPSQLVDLDGDGWLEYHPTVIDAPYVYFDARTYVHASAPVGLDFETSTLNVTGVTLAGYAQPYWANTDAYMNADSYQLLSAGLDGNYGNPSGFAVQRMYPSGANFSIGDRDNLANFAASRLDEELAQ